MEKGRTGKDFLGKREPDGRERKTADKTGQTRETDRQRIRLTAKTAVGIRRS